ncbi:ovarian cancer G-protein coupled receptor 1-like [Engraulis encrasicolus]|uniref:ovarian cancer G-protein coupled receptor 1-like n=1 Tax=Engraulis encrasicolus TaxID=184585 RepID=UPI002FD31B2C
MSQTSRLYNSSDNSNHSLTCRLQPVIYQSVVFPWVYLCLALSGFVANGLVLHRLRRAKRKPMVIFTLNMVASDIIQCFSLFFRMRFYLEADQWQAQDPMCGVTIFVSVTVFYINVYCNMLFLLWISLSRYATVAQSTHRTLRVFQNARLSRRISQVTWLGTVLVIGTHMIYKEVRGAGTTGSCFDHMNNRKKTNSNKVFAVGLVIFYPILVVMLCSYTLLLYHLQRIHRSSQVSQTQGAGGGLRVKKKVLVSLLVFLVCFLPYHVQRSIMILSHGPCEVEQEYFRVKTNTILVAAFHCFLNPVLYLTFRMECCRGIRRNSGAGIHDTTHTTGELATPT